MFWQKEKKTAHRAKKLTQGEITSHIEELATGESVSYLLPKSYGGQVAVVEFNTGYPWRGSKYLLSMHTTIDGKPVVKEKVVLESYEAKEIAAWLSERRGKLLNLTLNP